MSKADTFEGAKNAFAFVYGYMSTVGEEIGMERAIALDTKSSEMMGAAQGEAIREQLDLDTVDLATAASLAARSIADGIGIDSEVVEANGQRVVTKLDRCPVYEAAKMLGMDDATIETICRAGSIRYMDAMVKQWNPDLSYELKEFRSSADGHCLEELVLSAHA